MTRRLSVVALVLLPLWAVAQEKPLAHIAFGSCSDQEKPLPIFDRIVDLKPDLYLALGDNVYADVKPEPGLEEMASLRRKYEKLAAVPGWQRLIKTCPVMATWDDHDYGKNDVGVEYPHKAESQRIFLDFFGVPRESPRRTQEGIYHAATFGPEGKRVQVILLDLRYFRSPLKKADRPAPGTRTRPYLPNSDAGATFLGAEQWKWLEQQLRQPAELRLLVSSIQLLSDEHIHEKWSNIPAERDRLYRLLRETKANGVVVLSGDRHLAEISVDPNAIDYPLYDVTSSGLNQGNRNWRPPEPNRHRVGTMTHGDNFGFITIDWSVRNPKVTLQVRDIDGEIVLKDTISLSLLKPASRAAAALPHNPGPGTISPREALKKLGEKVVVEMKVQATGQPKSGNRIFLNSETDFRSPLNFTVVLNAGAMEGKWEKATQATFKDKVIRVTGTVSDFKGSLQIVVDDPAQLELLE
jgi:alkaline phosphatase D